MPDPYATLEITRDATQDEIKRAYRRLAKELHPDLNPGDAVRARKFREISAAYDVLSDAVKRREYDREEAFAKAAATNRAESRSAFAESFESFFRGRTGNPRRARAAETFRRGADVHHSLRISLVEAALGIRKRIALDDHRMLEVAVPAGTLDGQILRLKGQGAPASPGVTAGDALVEITVEPHPVFTRKEQDIHMTLSVTVPEAVQGASIQVPTVHGPVQIKVPRGSNTDTVLRLKGKGVLKSGGSAGDQYVTLKVVLPSARNAEFADLIEDWASRHSYSVRSS